MSEKPLTLALSQKERGLTARDFKSTANQALCEREKGLSACNFKNTANQSFCQRERGLSACDFKNTANQPLSQRERGLTVRDLKNVTGQLEGEGWGEGLLKNAGKKKPRQMAGLRYERGARKTVRYPGLR